VYDVLRGYRTVTLFYKLEYSKADEYIRNFIDNTNEKIKITHDDCDHLFSSEERDILVEERVNFRLNLQKMINDLDDNYGKIIHIEIYKYTKHNIFDKQIASMDFKVIFRK
jgi:hypothetical protein